METPLLRRAETAAGMLERFRPQTGANSRVGCEVVLNMGTCVPNHRGSATFGGSGSAQVIDGSQDQPQGLLLLSGHSQDLHGSLEFGELLRGSLLLLGLQGAKVRGQRSPSVQPTGPPSREEFGWKFGQTDLGMREDPEGALLSQVVEVQLGSERKGSESSGEGSRSNGEGG